MGGVDATKLVAGPAVLDALFVCVDLNVALTLPAELSEGLQNQSKFSYF